MGSGAPFLDPTGKSQHATPADRVADEPALIGLDLYLSDREAPSPPNLAHPKPAPRATGLSGGISAIVGRDLRDCHKLRLKGVGVAAGSWSPRSRVESRSLISDAMTETTHKRPWHQHFETVGSITAIVVGVAALLVSFDQSRVMREEIRASIWPALQLDGFVSQEADSIVVGLSVHNAGVGPALIERVTVRHLDEVVPDRERLQALMPPGGDLSFQTHTGRVMAAGETSRPFELRYRQYDDLDTGSLLRVIEQEWAAQVCYCSTLGQCWVSGASSAPPEEVPNCEEQPAGEF